MDSPIHAGSAAGGRQSHPSPRERPESVGPRTTLSRCSPAPSPSFSRCSLPRSLRRRPLNLTRSMAIMESTRDGPPPSRSPGSTCRGVRVRSRRRPADTHRRQPAEDHLLFRGRASIASPARSRPGDKFPTVRPSSRRRHRRPERGLHRDRRPGRARRPTRDGHPGRRVPALRQRGLPELGDARHRSPQRAGRGDRVQGQLQQRPYGPGRQRPRGPSVHPSQRSVRAERHDALRRLPGAVGRDHRGQRDRVQQHAAALGPRRCAAGPSSSAQTG